VFLWAIPIMGFIGTVLGIGAAIGGFGAVFGAVFGAAPPQSQQDRRADKQPLKKRIPVSRLRKVVPGSIRRQDATA